MSAELKSEIKASDVNWEEEFRNTAFKYHVLVAWVAVGLNPLWVVADYFNLPQHFNDFLWFRIITSLATLIGVLLKDKFRKIPEVIAFIPFLGISIQNAYMYSVMHVTEFEKHTFAYIALFIGASMFVLWKPKWSIVIVVLNFVANIIFFHFLSPLTLQEVFINGGMLTASVALFCILLINTRTNLTKKEIIARLALAKSNEMLAWQKTVIEEKNKDIQDSINYAKRIQQAILPNEKIVKQYIPEHFIYYKPKDVVAGDFYWFEHLNEVSLIAAADCTGHGVPGAMVSMVCSNALNRAVKEFGMKEPGKILDKTRDLVLETFAKSGENIKDGMDISLLCFNSGKVWWTGAHNPLWYVENGVLKELKGDKQPVGASDHNKPFTSHAIELPKGSMIYLITDGYADQFGGKDGKKFKYRRLSDLLVKISSLPLEEQKSQLNNTFEEWKGDRDQVDDVCIIGVRV